jgi:hypothetical protein
MGHKRAIFRPIANSGRCAIFITLLKNQRSCNYFGGNNYTLYTLGGSLGDFCVFCTQKILSSPEKNTKTRTGYISSAQHVKFA